MGSPKFIAGRSTCPLQSGSAEEMSFAIVHDLAVRNRRTLANCKSSPLPLATPLMTPSKIFAIFCSSGTAPPHGVTSLNERRE